MDQILSKHICDAYFKDDVFVQCVSNMCCIYKPPSRIEFAKIYSDLDNNSKKDFNRNKWLYDDMLKTKYNNINKYVLNNFFLDTETIHKFMEFINKYNFISSRIQLLKYHYRKKKMNVHKPEFTLTFQPFETLPENKTISIIEQHTNYHFSLYDLKKIISNALYKQSELFIEPSTPKNPYTNLKLSNHNLYIICANLNMNRMSNPIFRSYVNCHFDLQRFTVENYVELQMKAIKTYLSEKSNKYKLKLIKQIYKDMWNMKFNTTFIDTKSELQFINACYKLLFAYSVLECFDTGCYTINDYYEEQLEKEMNKIYNTYHLWFSKKITIRRNRNTNTNINININHARNQFGNQNQTQTQTQTQSIAYTLTDGYSYYNYFNSIFPNNSYFYSSENPIDINNDDSSNDNSNNNNNNSHGNDTETETTNINSLNILANIASAIQR